MKLKSFAGMTLSSTETNKLKPWQMKEFQRPTLSDDLTHLI
jgi:hypothetical protein